MVKRKRFKPVFFRGWRINVTRVGDMVIASRTKGGERFEFRDKFTSKEDAINAVKMYIINSEN